MTVAYLENTKKAAKGKQIPPDKATEAESNESNSS
jgi:hypothetical protein